MSVPMKRLPTEQVQVLVRSGQDQLYIGPGTKLNRVFEVLSKSNFKPVPIADFGQRISWEELAREDIEKYSKPGLVLRGSRIKEGLTQAELSKKLRIPQYNLSKMEHGNRPIGKKMAHKLGRILKIDYRVFL